MTNLQERHRGESVVRALGVAALLVGVSVTTATVAAGDSSYRRIVSQLRSEYRATEQSLYGAGVLGELAVALIRPAGVSKANFTILKELGVPRSHVTDFNRVVRSAVEAKWRPLVVHSSPLRSEWTHIYSQPDGKHIKLLIVNRARSDAFVAEVRIDPDRLSAFIDDPKILGIPVGNGDERSSSRAARGKASGAAGASGSTLPD